MLPHKGVSWPPWMTPPHLTTSSCARLPGHSLLYRKAASITVCRGASLGGALTFFRTPTRCRGPFGCLTAHRAPRGGPVQGTAPRGGFATTRDLGQFAFHSACHGENLANLISVGTAECNRFEFFRPRGTHSGRQSSWMFRSSRHGDTTY